MDKKKIGDAVKALADCCAAISGNFHIMHHNVEGSDFDTMHKKVLKTYYEQAADDFDELMEWAGCYAVRAENVNESAKRVEFKSATTENYSREEVIAAVQVNLEDLVEAMRELFTALNKITDCPISIGLANYVQDRLQYWAKEAYYFNARRK
jgi:DNA-binding ferritin-like protein